MDHTTLPDLHNLKSQYVTCLYELLDFDKSPKRKMLPNLNDGTTNISDGLIDIKVNINIASGDSAACHTVKAKLNMVFGVTNPN